LQCQDCCNYFDDPGCIGCQPDDSVYFNGERCSGFYDKKKEDLQEILMFWMVQGLYNREEINKIRVSTELHNILREQKNTPRDN
jgi:hypothetical protein